MKDPANFEIARYCTDLAGRADYRAINDLIFEIAPRITPSTMSLCALCGVNPQRDMWPPFFLYRGPYRVCMRCVERHGT